HTEESVILRVAQARGIADHLAEVVQRVGDGGTAPERAQVRAGPLIPEERVLLPRGQVTIANRLAARVERGNGQGCGAGNGDVGDAETLPEDRGARQDEQRHQTSPDLQRSLSEMLGSRFHGLFSSPDSISATVSAFAAQRKRRNRSRPDLPGAGIRPRFSLPPSRLLLASVRKCPEVSWLQNAMFRKRRDTPQVWDTRAP